MGTGSNVTISLPTYGAVLTLCEVKVFAAPASGPAVRSPAPAPLQPLPQPPPPCPCDTVSVLLSGGALSSHSSRAGDYALVDGVTSGGRPVYRRADGSYLYFWASISDWLVGPDYTSSIAWLVSIDDDNAACPTDTSSWLYWDGSDWMLGGVSITCLSPPPPPPPPSPPPPRLPGQRFTVCAAYGDSSDLKAHVVSCPSGAALTSLRLERCASDASQARYVYVCSSAIVSPGSTVPKVTSCNTDFERTIYMDRHTATCTGDAPVLSGLRVVDCTTQSGTSGQRYSYVCTPSTSSSVAAYETGCAVTS